MTTAFILLAFAVLFGATLVNYVRRRDGLSRDVMLIFCSFAALLALMFAASVFGQLPDVAGGLAVALLLAQPLFTLRVAHRLHPVARWVWIAAGAA